MMMLKTFLARRNNDDDIDASSQGETMMMTLKTFLARRNSDVDTEDLPRKEEK